MNPREALLSVRKVVESLGDEKVKNSYYLEFHRRLLVLELVSKHCHGGKVVDVGASPFILSCALKSMGFDVVAVDYDPEEYKRIAETCGILTARADLERDAIPLEDSWTDCAVFTEVIEHINPYYVGHTLAEINRVLKPHGALILTTPNIASLFRRLRLMLGLQPQYRYHVHEYTKSEIEQLLNKYGFNAVESFYSDVNDLTFVDAEGDEYLTLGSYPRLLALAIRRPTKLNLLRAAAYPVLKLVPSLRMLIVIVAQKITAPNAVKVERW